MTTSQTGADTARETASTAADEGKRVGSVGAEEVKNVAAEAKQQARSLVDEALVQVSDQTSTQRDRLVGTLQSLSSDLDQMAEGSESSGLATELARQAAGRARDLTDRLDGRDPSDILDDVRSFARRRPGMFLLGALAAGVVAGRLARGAKESAGTDDAPSGVAFTSPSATGYDTAGTMTPPIEAPGMGVPPVEPSYSAGAFGDDPLSVMPDERGDVGPSQTSTRGGGTV